MKRHPLGHFDDEHFCRCGAECCVDQATGKCLCRRCACHANRKTSVVRVNTYAYTGPYRRSYEVGVDLLRMSPVAGQDSDVVGTAAP